MRFIKTMKTKALAVFTVLCMLAGSAGMYVSAETGGHTVEEPMYSVNFEEGEWTVNGTKVTADKKGLLNITGTEMIKLVNFDPETMEAKVGATDGFSVELAVTEGKTSLSARVHEGGYPDGTLTFSVNAKQNSGNQPTNPQPQPRTYQVDFGTGSWKIGDADVTSDLTGEMTMKDTDVITLNGFDPGTMIAKVESLDGFRVELAVTEGKTSLSARVHEGGYPDGTLTFIIEAKQSGSQEGGNPVQPPETDSSTIVTLSGNIAFRINDSDFVGHENVETKDHTVRYNKKTDNNGNTTDAVDITISWLVNEELKSLVINGNDYSDYLPKTAEDYLKANKDQVYEVMIPDVTLKTDESNMISGTATVFEPGEMPVGNLKWAYEPGENVQDDELIGNGRMELVRIDFNGNRYSADQLPEWINWSQDDIRGGAVLPLGALVTVRLIPEYGYQLYKTNLNDTTFVADESEQSVFTFTVKSGNFHLGASFKETDNKVIVSTDTVVHSGEITIGENEIESGTALLSVNASDLDNTSFENALSAADGEDQYKINSVVDIKLDQVFYKGTESEYWANSMNDLKEPAEITLSIGEKYEDVVVIHEAHDQDGKTVYEPLQTTYNKDEGTVTFKTDSFSNFAIASRQTVVSDPISSTKVCIAYNSWQFGEDTEASVKAKVGENEQKIVSPFECFAVKKDEAATVTVTLPAEREGKTPVAEIRYFKDDNIEKVDVVKNMEEVSAGVFEFDLPSEISNYSFAEVEVAWSDFDYMRFELTEDEYMLHTIIHDDKEWGTISFEKKENASVSLNNEVNYIFVSDSKEIGNVIVITPETGYLLMDVIVDDAYGYFNYDNQDFEGEKYSLASVYKDGSYRVPIELNAQYENIEIFFAKCEEHHASDTVTGYKAPTCSKEGYSGDIHCTACGEVVEKGKAIPKTAHTYVDGICSVCGDVKENQAPVVPDSIKEEVKIQVTDTIPEKIKETIHKVKVENVIESISENNKNKLIEVLLKDLKPEELENADIQVKVVNSVKVTKADLKSEKKSITYEISPKAVITVNGVEKNSTELINDYFNKDDESIEITLPTNGLDVKEIVHKSEGYPTDYIRTFVISKEGTVTFKIGHFSSFTLNTEITKPADSSTGGSAVVDTGDHSDLLLYGGVGMIAMICGIAVLIFRRKHA